MFTYARTHIRKHLHKPVKRAGMRGHRSDCPLYVHVRSNVYVCVCVVGSPLRTAVQTAAAAVDLCEWKRGKK